MQPFPSDILLRAGLGPLKFGASPAEVLALLGKPDSTGDLTHVNPYFNTWDYSSAGCDLFFHDGAFWNPNLTRKKDPSLVMISVTNQHFTLFGLAAIGDSETAVVARLAQNGVVDLRNFPVEKYECAVPADKVLYFESNLLRLYLSDGKVTKVSWIMPFEFGMVEGSKKEG